MEGGRGMCHDDSSHSAVIRQVWSEPLLYMTHVHLFPSCIVLHLQAQNEEVKGQISNVARNTEILVNLLLLNAFYHKNNQIPLGTSGM